MLAVLLLAGCATIAEGRVERALLSAGLNQRVAACMAGRMTDRLSIGQLRKLEELRRPSANEREASLADYLGRVRRVDDAEVVAVTSSSAALCMAGLAS